MDLKYVKGILRIKKMYLKNFYKIKFQDLLVDLYGVSY